MRLSSLPVCLRMYQPQFNKAYAGEKPGDNIPRAEQVGEYKAEGWPVPDVEGLEKIRDLTFDRDKSVPGKETRVEIFLTKEGGRIARLSSFGNIFAYGYDTDMKRPVLWEIVDIDGRLNSAEKQTFEIKVNDGTSYDHPKWALK